MENFVAVLDQLEQEFLPVYANEGVFGIMLNIYLTCPVKFKNLIPMLEGFHMTKCVQHCIRKFIKSSGLSDLSVETKVLGVNVADAVLYGKHYERCSEGFQI